ncbi:hypothetical protein DRE_03213 [Drechslerella stenobrocha 248]|uniref:Uncharacterized protein n=1 Tax=Drechslerella stenobrocha 248 TaxID=1043628 RepID=W7I611_9PEZI|nr:hypothetical protein DRE_03213 [Drechslerella stenobrocha 248]
MEHLTPGTHAAGLLKVEKQIKQFLTSIDELLADLKSTKNDPSAWATGRLDALIEAIQRCAKGRAHSKTTDDHAGLDQRGTELWNMTTKLLRSEKEADVNNRKNQLKCECLLLPPACPRTLQ